MEKNVREGITIGDGRREVGVEKTEKRKGEAEDASLSKEVETACKKATDLPLIGKEICDNS